MSKISGFGGINFLSQAENILLPVSPWLMDDPGFYPGIFVRGANQHKNFQGGGQFFVQGTHN